MSLPMKEAFAYLRVSTSEQTVEAQRLQIQEFAKSRGFTVSEWFEDPAIHGTTKALEREGFSEMLATIKELSPEERPSNILVYEISRVGRSFWDILDVIRALEDLAPILSTSPKESFLQVSDRSMRQLMITILAWASDRELEYLKQRTKEGLAIARKNERHGGKAPLGYTQHVCEKLGHERNKGKPNECQLSGKLTLNDQGREVLQLLLAYGDDLTARRVKDELDLDKSKAAWSLLKSVKKFRDPSLSIVETFFGPSP